MRINIAFFKYRYSSKNAYSRLVWPIFVYFFNTNRTFLPVFVKQDKPRRKIQKAMILKGFNLNHIAFTSQNYKKSLIQRMSPACTMSLVRCIKQPPIINTVRNYPFSSSQSYKYKIPTAVNIYRNILNERKNSVQELYTEDTRGAVVGAARCLALRGTPPSRRRRPTEAN